jgi:acyl-CoA thioesterase I
MLGATFLFVVVILFSLGACSSPTDEAVQSTTPEPVVDNPATPSPPTITPPPSTPPPTTPPPTTPPPTTPPPSVVVAKVMPLGDSITASSVGLPSYRYFLWHLAVNHGYHIDFVGSLRGVLFGPPANADFDMDHEGHGGFSADQISDRIVQWASAASPDIVLLHIGTNDLHEFQSVQSTVDDIGSIIDGLRTVNPNIRILVAQLIASSNPRHKNIPALNAQLPALVAAKNSVTSPVVLVDQFTGFDPTTMTIDGFHPNAIGESRMADRWFEKLAPMLDAFP